MFGRKTKTEIASGNKIGSDNTIKNSLIDLDIEIKDLDKVFALLFPSLRKEILLRYRAETINLITLETYKIAQNEDIQLNPIPAKIALPMIEKMSLEHEPDMYEKWARLLIATGVKPNPIHQQYAEILSNLNNQNAVVLKEIYRNQPYPDMESKFDESINKYKFQVFYNNEESGKRKSYDMTEYGHPLKTPFMALPHFFHFPLIICGTEECTETYTPYYENGKAVVKKYNIRKLSNEDNNLLLGLEKLSLIKCYSLLAEEKKNEEGSLFYVNKCVVLLTRFGYSFVDCLEHPTK